MQCDFEKPRPESATSRRQLTTWLMPQWQTEWAVKTPDFLRISATAMGADLQTTCAANAALSVRPGTVFLGGEKFKPPRRSPFETFPLGLVRDSYLQVLRARPELGDASHRAELAAAAVHSCIEQNTKKVEVPREMRTWVVRGVQNLLTAVDNSWTSADYLDLSFEQVDELVAFDSIDDSDPTSIEWTIWGGVFATAGGEVRQLQSLCMSGAESKSLAPARLATAARVLADGLVTQRPTSWGAPYVPNPKQLGPAERVIIEMIGVNDGSRAILFDAEAAVARHFFDESARGKAQLIVIGGSTRATRKCLTCQAGGVCDKPRKRPGLLGLEGIAAWPRVLTPSALTTYRTCAHLSFLKDVLGLTAAQQEPSPAQRRGQLVHQWLAYGYTNSVELDENSLPNTGVDWIGQQLGWAEHDYQDVRPWLLAHLDAMIELATHSGSSSSTLLEGSALAEFEVVVRDTDADVLVTTRPDLLYANDNRTNWRETKTLGAPAVNHPDDFLEIYPQIPLAICILADRALGEEFGAPGQVELELLWPGGHRLITWDSSDEAIVAKARATLAQMTDLWVFDQAWLPPKNPPCRWCSLAEICEYANNDMIESDELPDFDPTTGEILGAHGDLSSSAQVARALGIIATFSEVDREEEVAF